MTKTMRILLASCGTLALASAATADTVRIGITQNNVGIDSYQTTYERAFIAAAEANPDVEVIVLDAGGDVARQISQLQDLSSSRLTRSSSGQPTGRRWFQRSAMRIVRKFRWS